MTVALPNWEEKLNSTTLKEFARIKLIAVDLDGTLIQSSKPEVWDNILWKVKNLRQPKFKLQMIVATGRTLTGAKVTIERLYSNKNLPVILFNGSLVLRFGDYKVLYKKTIDKTILNLIISQIQKYQVSIYSYYYLDHTETSFDSEIPTEYVLGWTNGHKNELEFNKMKIIWDVKSHYLDFNPCAILIDISNEKKELIGDIISFLNELEGISVTSSGFSYIEIRPANSDKSKALEFVSNQLDVKRDDILAIGDNDNDSEMLAWAGVGVCISNATSKALKASKYKCSHDVASGIIEVLNIIKLSKRYISNYEKNN